MNRGQKVTLWSAICLIGGALLPWIKATSIFGSISASGIEGDGMFTAGIGVIFLLTALFYKGKPGKIYSWAITVFAILAFVILAYVYGNLSGAVSEASDTMLASIGIGIYISILGTILGLAGGLTKLPVAAVQPVPAQEPPPTAPVQ